MWVVQFATAATATRSGVTPNWLAVRIRVKTSWLLVAVRRRSRRSGMRFYLQGRGRVLAFAMPYPTLSHNRATTCSIRSCPTWVSIGVVATLSWPSSAWMSTRSAPALSRFVASVCRNLCGEIFFSMPAFLQHPPQVGAGRWRGHRLLARRAGEHALAPGRVLQPEPEHLAEGFGQWHPPLRVALADPPPRLGRPVHPPPRRPVVRRPFALRSARAQARSWIIRFTAPWSAVARVAFAGSPVPVLA